MNILSLQITPIRPVLDQKDKKKRRRWNIWLLLFMRIEMPVREKDEFISTQAVFFSERVSFMYFLTSLRMIQLTFLFHDDSNVRDKRVERNYRSFGHRQEPFNMALDIDFLLRKVVIGEVIGKKICLTDEAIRNTMKRCDG